MDMNVQAQSFDLKTLDKAGLVKLAADVAAAIQLGIERERSSVVEEIKALQQERDRINVKIRMMAEEAGIDLSGLDKKRTVRKPFKPSALQYVNPANAEQKWSGRGRKPGWVSELLQGGTALESLIDPNYPASPQ